jgi:ketosteroid isomerase-like protein
MEAVLTSEQIAVKAGIDAWLTAVEGRDISLLPHVVTQDAASVWIGIGAGDWVAGFDALEQAMRAQNAALEDIHIQVSNETIHISPQADTAWATNQWVFNARMGDQALAMTLRCTWILEKRAGHWVIVHFHKSVGMPM